MIKIKFFILNLAICFTAFTHAYSLDETITMCDDCHGKNGVSTDTDIPSIAGYSATTISDMFGAYKDEVRIARSGKYRHGDTSRPETDMKTIANELTEEQLEEIANHYSEQTFVPAKQEFDDKLAAKGAKLHEKRCVKCHEEGGASPDDDAGIIAGQWMEFLNQAFIDYRSGERETDEEMQKKVNKLSEKQIEALVHYYASQQ